MRPMTDGTVSAPGATPRHHSKSVRLDLRIGADLNAEDATAMLDHITFSVTDIARSRAFYDAPLEPLGIRLLFEVTPAQSGSEHFMGYGEQRPYFWIAA